MNVNEHIGELAELYALGTLDETERAGVDAHAAACDACARRLGEAESVVAQTMPEVEPAATLDRRMRAAFKPRGPVLAHWSAIAAAAFVVGLLPGLLFAALHRPASVYDGDRSGAISAMVGSHFLHAQFTPVAAGAPKAKVLYGRAGRSWRFFVAQTGRSYTVAAETPAGQSALGALRTNGDSAELFVPVSTARTFVLLDGSRVLARVRLPALKK